MTTTPTDGTGSKHQVVAYTEKSQIKHENRHIQLVREYGFHPRTKATVEDGAVLPRKYEPFPPNMFGKPLEEIDSFIYEETFCVVSQRFRKNYIHRFTGTNSLFLFEPWSQTRRVCVYISTNQYFDYLVMITIGVNCGFLAMTETIEEAEYVFLAIYSCEMVIKIIAKGFLLNKYTYLRNPWNWLDFVVITSGYATIGMDVGNLAGLRTFRVLRALKTVSIMPGLKTIINALLHSFKQLAEVMTLTIFCLMVFALFALQVYMGELRNKCVRNLPDGYNASYDEWRSWINDTQNWIYDDLGYPMLCGNLTGARHCPQNHTCLCTGENPNHGFTNFDNFMWSMLTTFQLITLDYWENVYNMVLATSGPMSVSFFTVVVFFGSFYLINLMLAVVALAYEEEAEITLEERKKDLLDHRDDSTFSFDPSNLNVKKLNKNYKKKIDSRKGVLLASYSRKKTRRRKKGKEGIGNNQTNSRSVTPSPLPSPNATVRVPPPSAPVQQRTRGLTCQGAPNQTQNPNTLHPLGSTTRRQLSSSRQASSNASEGGINRESSLDDSGVVDDHDDQDNTNTELVNASTVELQRDMTPVTIALSPREIKLIKCNGNLAKLKKHNVYALHPEYLSQIVVLDDLPDRNCDKCVQCCVDYAGWLQFQDYLYKVVKDPLFELGITLCIVLNTLFLALEHHGMSESVRQALDIGNKVFTSIFTFECIIKLMALSKDFFRCGWNIFDLAIVSASLLDIIFELVEGLSVLRGLRLLRVIKLARSWTTMKVLLKILEQTIGALGNLTLILVIVIYIFAVIGMQLFSKDYTPDKFYPDPVPRWNFNDFFHSFMMIFRILCGEWIEPLWDCMRAEEKEGAGTCFAIFLPTLVMGNFMVLNLFLALLLNSFNSEELKNKKEEVGEESKLARSFDRIRSIVRKKRNKEKSENEANSKLEELVNEVIIRRRNEKQMYVVDQKLLTTLEIPQSNLYRHSYQNFQESMNRPVSGSDFGYDIPLKDTNYLQTINGSQETVRELVNLENNKQNSEDHTDGDDENYRAMDAERRLRYQMSSGFGTQHNDSKDEPTYAESFEMRTICPTNSTETDPEAPLLRRTDSEENEAYLQYQKSLLTRSPSYRKSIDRISIISTKSSENSPQDTVKKAISDREINVHTDMPAVTSIQIVDELSRRPSNQSVNTLSNDHDEYMTQSNLRDELLNCEQKDLFQFLSDDFDNSNNYFSETVGFGNTVIDPDTDSLVLDSKHDDFSGISPLPTRRKTSGSSIRSNFSYISGSIFSALEQKRGGSISESVDRKVINTESDKRNSDEHEPLMKDSEFENIIASFEKELNEIKKSTASLNRNISVETHYSDGKLGNDKRSSIHSNQNVLPRQRTVDGSVKNSDNDSVKIKRRSLEKQNKIDDGFSVSNEIRKICDNMQAPFSDSNSTNNTQISPMMRRKTDFHTSFDRIKRTSLIERVDETVDENHSARTHQILSEKLPRKYLAADMQLDSISMKSTGSYEHLIFDRDNQTKLPQKCDETTKLMESEPVKGETPKHVSYDQSKSPGKLSKMGKKNAPATQTDRPWHCLVSYVDDLTVGGRRNSKGLYEDPMSYPSFGRKKPPKVPDDCFPQHCYKRCPCWLDCLNTKWGRSWTQMRTSVLSVVGTPAFEWFILVLIFASSITLCFEDIHLDSNKTLKRILYWTNFAFSLIFVIEMVLKWMALGFKNYFTSFWTILDFIIVFVSPSKNACSYLVHLFHSLHSIQVSVFSLLIEENENLRVLRSLRTLRALRPLRAISRWQGMRIVVNALMYAIPSIFNVLLVCLVFWLIFSIMGVQFFGGKFFKCVDEIGEVLPTTEVDTRLQCLEQNYTWINSKITFDHVGMGYLALLQVATFEGWMEVMADAVDARGVDLQPQREANLWAYIYFVIFIVCGSFFTLNLFIGVIIDNFNMLKKKYEGGVLEMFLTESQKHYYTAMKKLGRKKPQKVIKRPVNHFLAMFYDLSNSRRFEIAIFVLIFLNMLTMGIEHYNQPHAVFFILEVSNAFFTTVFGLEAIVKIVGLRYHYFTVPWNVFDFLLVLASIFGILMEDIMIDLPISPTLLRVVRVFRIGRILRLIKAAKGIRKLLFALVVSLPALFNIGALLALITFIYAILGMSLFGHVRLQGALDDMVNFQTFGRSMQLLFRLMTSAGWNDVLESLMIQWPDCDPHFNNQANGDCGHPILAITYFTSFIIISYMIVINMYIAIILENFNQAHQEEEIGIVEDDLEMFYIRWSKYDPHATQFIHFSQVSDFLASLDPPLGIPKPNTVALVSFNLAISSGNKIHCLDILHALVKHVLGHVEETDTFKQLQEQMDVKFKKQFPTRKELEIVSSTRIWKREDKAARTLQNGWREYLRMKKERERSPLSQEDENTQTSSPGGWHSKLSALNFLHLQVHRRGTATSSRASSRKSSRASDASDLSELAGPWLNLPLMLVGGATDIVKNGEEEKKDTELSGSRTPRRRSFYSFFLRHQDAVDDCLTSPSVVRKAVTPSGTLQSLSTASVDDKPVVVHATPKSKRATSFIRKKPPLERGLSAQSALRINRNASVVDGPSLTARDVSILVTEPSPECPMAPPPKNRLLSDPSSTLVHVLVHRESEEYQTDLEDGSTDKDEKSLKSFDRSHSPIAFESNVLTPQPIVTIMVESPHEPPHSDFSINVQNAPDTDRQGVTTVDQVVIDIDDPIDVNVPRDTTNIFYDYAEPSSTDDINLRDDDNLTDQQHIDVIRSDSDADQPDSKTGLTS
ncbi:sodium channel protein 60E isoform X3 [Bradysia coprophila]|uniref:sodium channel protein 60E isoform X3 n=1 Tax=Bradysia coprophila TaxID=38358 RepID=UPI00187D8BAD|nr:sodium channel protein 60E isoform X3 [Bradysia coprophila]